MKPSTATKRDLLWRRRDREVFRGLWREIKRLRLELYTLRQTRRDNTRAQGLRPQGGNHMTNQPSVRRWKFRVEDPAGEGCYVGPDGRQDSEAEWIGTAAEASAEAQRRADAWEDATNGLCLRVVYESRGQV